MPWGRKQHSYFSYLYLLHSSHVYIQEVLYGVLYPKMHDNGFQKKKKGIGEVTRVVKDEKRVGVGPDCSR